MIITYIIRKNIPSIQTSQSSQCVVFSSMFIITLHSGQILKFFILFITGLLLFIQRSFLGIPGLHKAVSKYETENTAYIITPKNLNRNINLGHNTKKYIQATREIKLNRQIKKGPY